MKGELIVGVNSCAWIGLAIIVLISPCTFAQQPVTARVNSGMIGRWGGHGYVLYDQANKDLFGPANATCAATNGYLFCPGSRLEWDTILNSISHPNETTADPPHIWLGYKRWHHRIANTFAIWCGEHEDLYTLNGDEIWYTNLTFHHQFEYTVGEQDGLTANIYDQAGTVETGILPNIPKSFVCEYDLCSDDEVATHPCQNGGVCYVPNNSTEVSCNCMLTAYSGDFCETCEVSKCLNGGSCVNDKCNCAGDWEGPTCSLGNDVCTTASCQNGGRCTPYMGIASCTCVDPYFGSDCSMSCDSDHEKPNANKMCVKTDYCHSSPCNEWTICKNNYILDAGYECVCSDGFRGANCNSMVPSAQKSSSDDGGMNQFYVIIGSAFIGILVGAIGMIIVQAIRNRKGKATTAAPPRATPGSGASFGSRGSAISRGSVASSASGVAAAASSALSAAPSAAPSAI